MFALSKCARLTEKRFAQSIPALRSGCHVQDKLERVKDVPPKEGVEDEYTDPSLPAAAKGVSKLAGHVTGVFTCYASGVFLSHDNFRRQEKSCEDSR